MEAKKNFTENLDLKQRLSTNSFSQILSFDKHLNGVLFLEFLKLLLGGGGFGDFDNVEANSFRERATFTHRHHITLSYIAKARRAVGRDVFVTLFKTFVFPNKVKIISPYDYGSLHLHLLHDSGQNSAANLDEAGERAFLVHVNAVFRLIGSLAAQKLLFAVEEYILLLLKGTFSLIRHLIRI